MSLYAFHLRQIISTVLGQVDHGGHDGNAARTRIHGAICRTIKALAILRCLYSSEMVLLGVVIRKCETLTTNISQENGHGMLMIIHVNLWLTTREIAVDLLLFAFTSFRCLSSLLVEILQKMLVISNIIIFTIF